MMDPLSPTLRHYLLLTSCHQLVIRDRATDTVFLGSNGDDAVYQYSVASQVVK